MQSSKLCKTYSSEVQPAGPLRMLLWQLRKELALVRRTIPDVLIVSYPKSGRTWLRMLLSQLIIRQFKLDVSDAALLELPAICDMANVPTIAFTHGGSGLLDLPDYHSFNRALYRRAKVILLLRDPRDVIVSYWHEVTKRKHVYESVLKRKNLQNHRPLDFEGSISDLISSERFGIRKWVAFHNMWYEHQTMPNDFCTVWYEDLHERPIETLHAVLEVIGIDVLDSSVVKEAANASSFDAMKRMEKEMRVGSSAMRPGDTHDPESFKVRRGKIGGYIDYLSPETVTLIDRTVTLMGCPFWTERQAHMLARQDNREQ